MKERECNNFTTMLKGTELKTLYTDLEIQIQGHHY